MNPRQRWALATLLLPVIVVSMDLTVLYLAAPALAAQLNPSASELLWIMDIYGFVLAALLIPAGTLGDRIGRRRLLAVGATLFGAASVGAAFAPTAEWLIAARALMGVGGATLMPSTLALIRTTFPDDAMRGRAIGLWTAAFAAGGALGPIVAGALLEFFPWGSVFLINAPVVIVLLFGLARSVRETDADRTIRVGILGAIIGLTLIVAAMGLLKYVGSGAWGAAGWVLTAMTIAAAMGFWFHQSRSSNPWLDRELLANPAVRLGLTIVAVGMFALTGPNMYLAQYYQLVLGLSPLLASLSMLPMAAFGVAGAIGASILAQRLQKERVVVLGLCAGAAGLLALIAATHSHTLILVIIAGALLSAGITAFLSLATDITVSGASERKAGAASALSETSSELGAALSIAILGTIGTVVYRSTLSLASGIPIELARKASESITAADSVAQSLGAESGGAVLQAARDAFTVSQGGILGIAAAVLVALALFVGIRTRTPSMSGAVRRDSEAG